MSSTTTTAPPTLALTTLMQRVRQRLSEHDHAPLSVAPNTELTELVQTMEAVRAQLDSAELAVIREVDRRDAAKELGATGTTAWLRSGPARMRPGNATQTVRLGKELDQTLHHTRDALAAGKLSVDHADVIAHAIRALPKEADAWVRAEAEQVLVKHAQTFNPHELAVMAKTILDVVDPDLADRLLEQQLADEEKKAARARELSLSPEPYGDGTRVRGKLDPETAEMLRTCLDPFAKPRPKDATGERDQRSYPERMGDALHEFLRQTLDRGDVVPTHAGTRPHVVITVKAEHWLTGTGYGRFMMSQQPVSMETLYRIASDAIITVIEQGIKAGDLEAKGRLRLVKGLLAMRLHARDKGCAFPGCDKPPSHCESHHIIPWHRGGPTILENLVLLCRYHHKLMDQHHWEVRINPDDKLPEFVPPPWVDENQRPLRNTRLQI